MIINNKPLLVFQFVFSLSVMTLQNPYAADTKTYTIAVLDLEANGVSAVEAKGLPHPNIMACQ